MRAVLFDDYGDPDVLYAADVPTPEPGPGEIRIRIRAAAVNPADPKWRAGMFRAIAPMPLPHVLGYDVAGIVDSLGEGVVGPAAASRVVAMLPAMTKGGYAELAIMSADEAVPIPDEMEYAVAAALPTAGLTGVQLIADHVRPAAGETVLITGAVGAVGRFALDTAVRSGVRVIAAVRQHQMAAARALGAAEVIRLGGDEWSDGAFDHVADTVGGADVAALCRHVRNGGRIRTVATTAIDPAGLPDAPLFISVRSDPAGLAAIVRAVAAGEVAVPVARRLPLARAAAAHRLVEAGGAGGKIILEP